VSVAAFASTPMRKAHASSTSVGIPSETLRRTWASCLAAIGADVPTPARDGDISCRQLFDVLDGRVILAANQSWQVRVYAVVDDGASRWVQMTVGGRTPCAVTLHLGSGEGSKPVIRALATWLNMTTALASERPEVVSTSRCA